MNPNPHSFKVLDTHTGEYLPIHENELYVVSHLGQLTEVRTPTDETDFILVPHLRPVFPHEERQLEFAPREGESFVDRCNRLFKKGDKVWVSDLHGLDEWQLMDVCSTFSPPITAATDMAICSFKPQEPSLYQYDDRSFNEADLEFNLRNPLHP